MNNDVWRRAASLQVFISNRVQQVPPLISLPSLAEVVLISEIIFDWNENRRPVYSSFMDSCEFIIRNANNVHIVFKRKEAGNETVSFNNAGITL